MLDHTRLEAVAKALHFTAWILVTSTHYHQIRHAHRQRRRRRRPTKGGASAAPEFRRLQTVLADSRKWRATVSPQAEQSVPSLNQDHRLADENQGTPLRHLNGPPILLIRSLSETPAIYPRRPVVEAMLRDAWNRSCLVARQRPCYWGLWRPLVLHLFSLYSLSKAAFVHFLNSNDMN